MASQQSVSSIPFKGKHGEVADPPSHYTKVLIKTNNQIFTLVFYLMWLLFLSEQHTWDAPHKIPAITTSCKAWFTVKTEKTVCLLVCEIYRSTLCN